MPTEYEVSRPRDAAETAQLGELFGETFLFPRERVAPFLQAAGPEAPRVVRSGGQLAGGLMIYRLGQFFGGKSVPMAGIGVVGIAPEHRARGAASALLRAVLCELHEQKVALSCLYPATVPVYRRVGYELAGTQTEVALRTAQIDARRRNFELRHAEPADLPQIHELYRRWAVERPGNLDRNDFMWQRVRNVRGEPAKAYVLSDGKRLAAYLYCLPRPGNPFPHAMTLTDLVAREAEAVRDVLAFLAAHRSMVAEVNWFGGATDPLWLMLEELPISFKSRTPWMMRVVHVAEALRARGYSPAVQAELHLDVRDELLAGNAGRIVLRVRDGKADVTPGGNGSLAVDVRGLAALFTGYLSAEELAAAALIAGPPAGLAAASGVFAGPAPWMRDMY